MTPPSPLTQAATLGQFIRGWREASTTETGKQMTRENLGHVPGDVVISRRRLMHLENGTDRVSRAVVDTAASRLQARRPLTGAEKAHYDTLVNQYFSKTPVKAPRSWVAPVAAAAGAVIVAGSLVWAGVGDDGTQTASPTGTTLTITGTSATDTASAAVASPSKPTTGKAYFALQAPDTTQCVVLADGAPRMGDCWEQSAPWWWTVRNQQQVQIRPAYGKREHLCLHAPDGEVRVSACTVGGTDRWWTQTPSPGGTVMWENTKDGHCLTRGNRLTVAMCEPDSAAQQWRTVNQ